MKNKFLKYTVTIAVLAVLIGGTFATANGYNLEDGVAAVVNVAKKKIKDVKNKKVQEEKKSSIKVDDAQNNSKTKNNIQQETQVTKPNFTEKVKSTLQKIENNVLPFLGIKNKNHDNCALSTTGTSDKCVCHDVTTGKTYEVDLSYCSNKGYYTLQVDSTEGGRTTGKKGKIKAGTKVSIKAIPNRGYYFSDWDGDDDACKFKESCSVVMNEDKYLTAQFKPFVKIQDPNKCSEFVKKLFNSSADQRTFTEKANAIINSETLSDDEKDHKLKVLLGKYVPIGNLDKDKFNACFSLGYTWPW